MGEIVSNHEEQKYHSSFYTMILEMLLGNGHLTDENILHLIIENNSADYVMLFKYENNYTQLLPAQLVRGESVPSGIIDINASNSVPININVNDSHFDSYKMGAICTTYNREAYKSDPLYKTLNCFNVDYKSAVSVPLMLAGKLYEQLVIIRIHDDSEWSEEEIGQLPLISKLLVVNHERNESERQKNRWHDFMMLALSNADIYTWEYDIANDHFHNNKDFMRRRGYKDPLPIIPGHSFVFTAIHPDYQEMIWREFQKSLATVCYKKLQAPVLVFKDTGNVYEWVEFSFTSISFSHKAVPDCVIGTATFIDRQKRYEKAIADMRTELQLALETSEISSWSVDAVSQEVSLIYTYDEMFIKDNHFTNLVFKEDLQEYHETLDELISGKKNSAHLFLRLCNSPDEIRYYYVYMKVVLSESSGKVQRVICTARDNTTIKKNEADLQDYRVKMEMATRSSGLVFWEYDTQTHKSSSTNYNNYRSSTTIEDLVFHTVFPEDAGKVFDMIKVLSKGEMKKCNVAARIKKSGDYCWMDVQGTASAWDKAGNVTKITGILRDISSEKELLERRNIQDELVRLKEKAEQSDRLKSAFLANMSHEIRTPLNAIIGFSNLVNETSDKEEREEYIKIINTNNDLLLRLINDIIDLSKIESGTMAFTFTDFDVNQIIDTMISTMTPRVHKGVVLVKACPVDKCVIFSEKNRLEQILINFLTNAIKYTSQGSITIGYSLDDYYITFFVQDTGKGISPENVEHVFERFSKFDPFVQGTGLGLFICKTIVDYLNGKIGVESEVGKGSRFWTTIPRRSLPSKNDEKRK